MKIYKHSKQRQALLSLLRFSKNHPTAAWLYDELRRKIPDISQGTVYRNLNVLVEQKLVRVINSGSKAARFDADMSPHYHVICTCCGKVQDITLPPDMQKNAQAEAISGYKIENHNLDFFGICPDCQESQEKIQSSGI
ncbi:transcriptional repressor [Treponema phagedenis]|uniref:Transcriptional regulator, Fur family n=1 Tax=Treponema phagedenis TaxID=162 RepID=A0A0B7GSN5_TREPH|nr:transcriptional repressor [Treponema phagedenis]EFW36912.1 transcriptional regulator, Fur family [Treponema phagedenis F0421]NVP23016.1 transcriptional repressor [Treponema phagedenis]QEJ95135.1 transcriptional repressor [Treponema phagedenis]QEJ98194.1 transcriptional repressor [Treponema phagedenis]QEK01059.1 transcriptional repressor [Treponema phagedenis]